jgi:hypothetical protein
MKLSPKFLLVLAFAMTISGRSGAQEVVSSQFQADVTSHAPASLSTRSASEASDLVAQPTVTHYATGFDGDHSLEEATVVEQGFARYTLYTLRLQFASGAEQSIVLTAPPGGLEPRMLDMNGDSVPNDLVLTSRLLGLPLIVLLNEGHDCLTVAISPGSFAAGEDRASGPREVHRALALMSSRIKRGVLSSSGGLSYQQLQEKILSPLAYLCARNSQHPSAPGRAPPVFVTPL